MRKVFVDCGSLNGDVLHRFHMAYGSEWEYVAFEPNPQQFNILYDRFKNFSEVCCNECAVCDCDGFVDLYVGADPHGSSIYKNKITGNIDKDHPINVKCVDLDRFISTNYSENDLLIIKINTEGAEYKILNKLMDSGTIKWIKLLYVAFHGKKKIPELNKTHLDTISRMKKMDISYVGWKWPINPPTF